MARAALSLGGNLGDARATIAAALAALEASGVRVVARSSDYRTRPWGKTDQPDFTNVSAVVETALAPLDLLATCLDVERRLGRLNLCVDDLDAIEAKVVDAGLRPFNHGDYEPGRRFYFFDPDGIEYEVVSYAARPAR